MSRHDNDNDIDVSGPALPSFTTAAYYQGLSQDERQYGEEAEYRQQFYNFIEQLHQQLYEAVANGDKIINRGDLYQPYPDNPQLQAQVNEFFDTLFPSNGSAIVENILSSDLFAGAVTEYNRASGNFDFAANWDSLSSPSQLQEQAQLATAENAGVYSTLLADIMGIPDNQKEAFIEWSNASLTGGNAREILEANPGLSNTIFNREGDQPTIYEAIGQLGDFEDFDATAVRENAERDIMGQLQGLSENVLNILFGSTNVEEILQQQLETAFPPSPSDPDYEQKFNEWIKRQSDSIISINHVPNAENPIFAGIRFPVPLPVSGPETIIPLFNQDGVYVGPGNLSEIFVGEDGVLTQVKEGVTQTIGRLTENGAAIFGEDGTIAQVIDLGEAVIDELGNVSYQPTDPNLMEGIDPETGLPTGDGGLPFDEEEDEEEVSANELAEGDSDLNGTDDLEDAEDIETESYSGMFDDVPEDDRLAYLSDVEAAKEEILDTLGTQLSDLGVEVEDIDQILEDVQEQLEGVATTEDLDELRTSLEGTISDGLSALGIEDIQSTLTAVETDIDDLDTAISDLTTAVSGLNNLSTEDVEGIVTDALADLENLSEDDVTDIVSDIVDDLNNLGAEDVEGIVSDALADLENLSEDEVQDIVNDIVGSPATDEAESTGLYGAIEDVSTQISTLDTDLNNRIDDLVESGVARADAVDQALSELAIANQTSEENILAQIGTTEEALSGQISDLDTSLNQRIDDLVKDGVTRADAVDQALAELAIANQTSEENILNQLGTTEAALSGQISDLGTDLNSRIDALVDAGVTRADAVDQALADLAIANQTTEEAILEQIGTTEAALTGQISGLADAVGAPAQVDELGNIVADSTGIYAEIDALEAAGIERADAVDQVLSNLADQYDTNTETILNQIGTTEGLLRADISDVGADVQALAETVGQDTQYDDQGNVVTEATGIFAEFDNLIDQGANEYQALTTAISNVSDQIGTTEETLFGAIADSENRLSDIIGSPSVSDDPNTPEDETIPATGIYADIEQSTSDISSAVGSAIGGMGGFEKFMGGFDYSPAQFVAVEYQPPKDYMVELDRMIDEGFKDVFNDRQNSMFGDMI